MFNGVTNTFLFNTHRESPLQNSAVHVST